MTGHPLRLDAIELQSRRHVAMIRWYQIVLEAEVIHRDAIQCWLRSGGGTTLILLASAQVPRPREVAGIAGPAFVVPDEAALAGLCRRLERLNIYPERALRSLLATSLFYRDPDGNPVAFKALAAIVPQGATVDPLGEEIDPRGLGVALQAQAS